MQECPQELKVVMGPAAHKAFPESVTANLPGCQQQNVYLQDHITREQLECNWEVLVMTSLGKHHMLKIPK